MAQSGSENTWRILLWIGSILRGGPVGTEPAWCELFLLRQHPVLHPGQAVRARFRTGRLPVKRAIVHRNARASGHVLDALFIFCRSPDTTRRNEECPPRWAWRV